MTHNKGYCFNCGEPTENDEEIGNTTVYCCDKSECHRELRECHRELREERQAERDERIDRAREDDYSRY